MNLTSFRFLLPAKTGTLLLAMILAVLLFAVSLVGSSGMLLASVADAPQSVPAADVLVVASRQVTETETITATAPITDALEITDSVSITATPAVTDVVDITDTASLTGTAPITDALSLTDTASITETGVITEPVADPADEDADDESDDEANDGADLDDADQVSDEEEAALELVETITIAVSDDSDADEVNVYTGPGADFAIVGQLADGVEKEVLEISPDGAWYRVQYGPAGWWGWVAAESTDVSEPVVEAIINALDETADAASDDEADAEEEESEENDADVDEESVDGNDAAEEVTVPTAEVRGPRNLNVRGGPGTNYPIILSLAPQGRAEIIGANGDWYRIKIDELEEDGQAWIFASLVDVLGPGDDIPEIPDEELPAAPEAIAPAETAPASGGAVTAAAAPAPPPAGGGFFGYGVQAHMLGGGIDAALNATGGMGFNWIKQQVQWREFEGSQGQLDFSELRRIVDGAGARGISVLFSVVNAPDWAREPGFDGNVGGPPADPQSYGNFVARIAGDFCGTSLKAIEVWNEQNLHYEWGNRPINPEEYMNLLRVAYGRIKGACPSMLVISGAPTPAGDAGSIAMDDFAYLERMYQAGLAGLADGIGVHPSGYNVPPSVGWEGACATIQSTGNFFNGPCDTPHHSWSFRSTMEGYRNIMVRYGDTNKRLWPTEFGWAAGGALHPAYAYAEDNSYEEQAQWTVESFQMMRNWGWVGPTFLWNLNFRVVADGTEKAQWGIVRNDYSPLPVYEALRAMPK